MNSTYSLSCAFSLFTFKLSKNFLQPKLSALPQEYVKIKLKIIAHQNTPFFNSINGKQANSSLPQLNASRQSENTENSDVLSKKKQC